MSKGGAGAYLPLFGAKAGGMTPDEVLTLIEEYCDPRFLTIATAQSDYELIQNHTKDILSLDGKINATNTVVATKANQSDLDSTNANLETVAIQVEDNRLDIDAVESDILALEQRNQVFGFTPKQLDFIYATSNNRSMCGKFAIAQWQATKAKPQFDISMRITRQMNSTSGSSSSWGFYYKMVEYDPSNYYDGYSQKYDHVDNDDRNRIIKEWTDDGFVLGTSVNVPRQPIDVSTSINVSFLADQDPCTIGKSYVCILGVMSASDGYYALSSSVGCNSIKVS